MNGKDRELKRYMWDCGIDCYLGDYTFTPNRVILITFEHKSEITYSYMNGKEYNDWLEIKDEMVLIENYNHEDLYDDKCDYCGCFTEFYREEETRLGGRSLMLDKMQIEKILSLNKQLNKDIGKLQIEKDILLAESKSQQEENDKLKADLRGKDNEINDLIARIKYLEQFKPKTKDIPTSQG